MAPKPEPIKVSSVRMPVVRNLTHMPIDLKDSVAEPHASRERELLKHVDEGGLGRFGAMRFPHHHRH